MQRVASSLVGALVFSALAVAPAAQAQSAGRANVRGAQYADVLDMRGTPRSPVDCSFNIFFDDGAWQGYSLPPVSDGGTGFVGPFVASLRDGRWVGARFAQVSLTDPVTRAAISLRRAVGYAGPGYLQRRFVAPGLAVTETLFFANSRTALVRIQLTSATTRSVMLTVSGVAMPGARATFASDDGAVVQTFPQSGSQVRTRLHTADDAAYVAAITNGQYRLQLTRPLDLQAHTPYVVFVAQTLLYDAQTAAPAPVDFATAWARNRQRWNAYLAVASRAHLQGLPAAVSQRVAVKAIETLIGNWRAPRGDLLHAGLVPSYSNPAFNECVWSWDSWKQAAGLSLFAPRLAEDNLREVFDYQKPDGMIPDMVCLHKRDNNWRNSKPPLATWAALKIYRATGDKAFLSELYPKLVRYHDWWFKFRDHAHDGLAEYGSTDGTTQAAKWESGMDDAARFDDIKMLWNGPHAWSMNQEAVDLDSYLYRDATDFATIAGILGEPKQQAMWEQRATTMRAKIRARFFDKPLGYFFDVQIPDGKFVKTYGPEGWIPLWAGAATAVQATVVARVIASPRKFDTYMPFPTLAADDPRFAPVKGYWRGPVWIDQAYFAVRGLQRYSFDSEANQMALRLVTHAQGLTGDAPIRENYDPLTGGGLNSQNFSWSAACYLLLLEPSVSDAAARTAVRQLAGPSAATAGVMHAGQAGNVVQ